jgi:L-fucose isomerase
MRTTPIGIAMLNDERPHVFKVNNAQNMEVVRQWTERISARIQTVDGSTPEIVMGSKTIYSPRVAREVGEELVRAGCRSLIMCYNVWDYPYLAWPLVNTLGKDKPILSLSNNNGEFPGNVGLLATDGALRQAGLRTHRIVGDMDDAGTLSAVTDWVRASQAITNMRNEVYGMYGGHSMGMETGFFQLAEVQKILGTTVYSIDQYQLVKIAEGLAQSEVDKGIAWLKSLMGERIHWDNDMLTEETLGRQIRIYLAMQQLNEEYGFTMCGLKGQRELTENNTLGDIPEMVMNDPYDWNGPKEPMVCATEADSNAALTQQILKYVTGGLPTLFMDVRLYLPEQGIWDFCNSGNHASWYAERSFDPAENFKKISLHPALKYYFKAGGASVEFNAKGGLFTFARLGFYDQKPFMYITLGDVLDLPADEAAAINAQTNPTWPHVHARLQGSFEEFATLFPANHIQAAPGDLVRPLVNACEIAGITPIVIGDAADRRIAPIWERVR